ncbi:MAG: 6-phosphogluconolactonase, partial [Victivallales bacterium]|nr:6-phosphogluconolactonase [Victivallales bacterium]
MEHLILDKNSLHFIKYFKNYEELAFLSVPYLAETKVAISGGNTYKKLFEYWKYYKNRLKNTEFFPVDERKVPFNSEDSNWGAAYRNFLSKINRDSDKGNYT